jgi:RecA-family ATPase
MPATPSRVFGVFAEDDADELHRRLHAIARAEGVAIDRLDDLAWRCAVTDQCELVEPDNTGQLQPTTYYQQLETAVRVFGARLVVLDAATNLYGGDEVKRRQVNAFIALLRRFAIAVDGAVLLLAHPSVQGINTGSGLSGSTHWNNAVRSRLYFKRGEGEDADPDERTLTRLKANYAGAGDVIRVRWNDGAFVALDPPSGIDRAAIGAKADRIFVSLLATTYQIGSWTCPNPTARNYAPSMFAKHPDRDGLSKPVFEKAMHRLLKTDQIKVETYGRPSDPHKRLAPA